MSLDPQNIIWIDLEMTGLDSTRDQILEIATVVTNKELEILATGPEIVIHQPDAILDKMDDWNQKQHGSSGLIERVKSSTFSIQQAQDQTLAFLRQFVLEGTSPMAGNSICQDRRFLARLMPALESFFHYRNLDVSTLKELAARWNPELLKKVKKTTSHRALDDVIDSINELKFYRSAFFVR